MLKNYFVLFLSLFMLCSETWAQSKPLPEALGTAHARPRYNPHGSIHDSFYDGAVDAYNLGFRTLKIWNGHEILDPSFYFLSPADRNKWVDFSSALDIQTYKKILALPFQTIVFESDDLHYRTDKMFQVRFTQEDRNRIYQQVYSFAARLRREYNGSNKKFIIQNHEGEWHLTKSIGSQEAIGDPGPIAMANIQEYLSLRQQAVNRAKADVPSTAQIFHLCEVVRLWPSIKRSAPSIAQDVLPNVACDLVGYSAYESLDGQTDSVKLDAALAYLRSKARPSPTFGTNQVVVSEIGTPERRTSVAQQDYIARVMKSLLDRGMPYVLFWNMYDNECTFDCSSPGTVSANIPEEQLLGFWVRKPNGSLGHIFSTLAHLISTGQTVPSSPIEPNRVDLINQCYRHHLGRAPDTGGFQFWLVQPQGFSNICEQQIKNSPEARIRQCYLTSLRREPDRAGMDFWLRAATSGTATVENICQQIAAAASKPPAPVSTPVPTPAQTEPNRAALINQCYVNYLGRNADTAGLQFWVAQPQSSATICEQQIKNSPEAKFRRCYQTHLGRVPDAGAMRNFLSTPKDADAFCRAHIQNSNEARIRQCYLRNLGREPDSAGLNFWLAAANNGTATIDHICSQIRK